MSRKSAVLVSIFFVVALMNGCDCDSTTEPVDPPVYGSITISSSMPGDTLLIGETVQFTAVVTDTAGDTLATASISWASSNEDIAKVNVNGVVEGTGEGVASITAAGGGVTSSPAAQIVLQGFGWVGQPAPVVSNLNGCFFIDRQRGWAVGDVGVVLFTDDAGVTWTQQQSNVTGFTLHSVFFLDENKGFSVGSAGQIIRTFDAGMTWTQLTGQPTGGLDLKEIRFFDNLTGVIVGNQGLIMTSDDGGDSWARLLPSVTSTNLNAAFAIDEPLDDLAWIVGNSGTIVSTRTSGDDFNIVTPTVTSQNLMGVWRLSNTEAIAVGGNNTVLNTVASGDSALWQLAPPPGVFGNFGDVSYPVAAAAYAVGINVGGNALILKSDDGAFTWVEQVLPSNVPLSGNDLRGVWFVNEFTGWTVGRGGLIIHTATGGD